MGGTGYFICIVPFVNKKWSSRKVNYTWSIFFKSERHKNKSYYKWNKQIHVVILSVLNKK